MLLLSRFGCVRLCATPETAAHQAPLSLGFSRQEHWSGLPLLSPMHESEKWKWSRSVVSDSKRPHELEPTRLLRLWDFLGKSTGVGCHCLLQYITLLLLKLGPIFSLTSLASSNILMYEYTQAWRIIFLIWFFFKFTLESWLPCDTKRGSKL